MSKFFKIKSEQLKPTTPKPTIQPANGYQWSWNVDTAQWEQVPVNSQYSYNITDDKNRVNTSNTNYITQTTGYTTASRKNVISCLSQFINVDDFNDGILFVNGLKYKPTYQMYQNGLVKYAGYDVVNGSMCKITSKGLNLIKNYELDNYNRLRKQIESSIGDTTDVPSTIPGFDFPCEGIKPEDGTYDTDNKKFATEDDLDLDNVWSIRYKFSDDNIKEYMVTDFDGKYYILLNLKDINSQNVSDDSYWKVSERFIRENVKNGKMQLTYDY